MKQEDLVEVRRLNHDETCPWIVDILADNEPRTGYVRPDGSSGRSFSYIDKLAALSAARLYYKKHGEETVEITTSADGRKDTNPKQALGIKKVPTHCIPTGPMLELGLAMMEGGRKYGTHNYRAMGVRYSAYHDAIVRHLKAWWEGEDIDEASGLHHLIKIMGCCVVVRDSMLMENAVDDRPLQYPGGLDMAHYDKLAADLIEKYPDCVVPYLETNKGLDRTKPVPGGY